MDAPPPCRQTRQELEGAGGVRQPFTPFIDQRGLAEGQRGTAVQQLPVQTTRPSAGRMKVVFISIVTTPRGSGPSSGLRGARVACAIATSSSVMTTPPCATCQLLHSSSRSVNRDFA